MCKFGETGIEGHHRFPIWYGAMCSRRKDVTVEAVLARDCRFVAEDVVGLSYGFHLFQLASTCVKL
ncbi:hypothetical protein RYX36_012152, partial [Vicia faba]